MFVIKTATGKEFHSDYATSVKEPLVGFVRILGEDMANVMSVFKNKDELPIDIFPQFNVVSDYVDEGDGIKLILKP